MLAKHSAANARSASGDRSAYSPRSISCKARRARQSSSLTSKLSKSRLASAPSSDRVDSRMRPMGHSTQCDATGDCRRFSGVLASGSGRIQRRHATHLMRP